MAGDYMNSWVTDKQWRFHQPYREVDAMQFNRKEDLTLIQSWIKEVEQKEFIPDCYILLTQTDWLVRTGEMKYTIIKDEFFQKHYEAKPSILPK